MRDYTERICEECRYWKPNEDYEGFCTVYDAITDAADYCEKVSGDYEPEYDDGEDDYRPLTHLRPKEVSLYG